MPFGTKPKPLTSNDLCVTLVQSSKLSLTVSNLHYSLLFGLRAVRAIGTSLASDFTSHCAPPSKRLYFNESGEVRTKDE